MKRPKRPEPLEIGRAFAHRGRRRIAIVGLATMLALAMGCFSYSSYQDARITPKATSEATFSVSASSFADDYSDEREYWYPIELSPRFHLASRFDAGLRFSFLLIPGESEATGVVVVGGDIRGAVIPNRLVLSLPVAFAVGDNTFSTFQIQPGAIVTIPVLDKLDVNGSARLYLYTGDMWGSEDELNSWGYTAGLGWHVSSRVTIRPEVGWLVFGEGDPSYMQFGLGVTLRAPIGSDPEVGH